MSAETVMVWAIPRSIATTKGITIVFSSSGYLDVSVLRVCHPDKSGLTPLHGAGLPHSEIFGYSSYLHFPEAYRSLSRPSSPLRAKASAMRSYLLSSVNEFKNLALPIRQRTFPIPDTSGLDCEYTWNRTRSDDHHIHQKTSINKELT